MAAGEKIAANGDTNYVTRMAEEIKAGGRSVLTLTISEIVSLREQHPDVNLEPQPETLPVAWDARLNPINPEDMSDAS